MDDGFTRADQIFSADVIARLAKIGRFPVTADLNLFGELLRLAAGFYLEDRDEPSVNTVHREVEQLYKAKIGLDAVSQATRRLIKMRADRLGISWPPSMDEIRKLSAFGGRMEEDRKRAKDRRGKVLKPMLFAPDALRHPPKREAERIFLGRLRDAVFHATGKRPPITATYRPSRLADETLIGPYARMVREVFRLCRSHVDVADIMNRAWRASKTRQAGR